MARRKAIGKRRELCMDTSVSYIAKPRGAIAFVIKLTAVFLGGRGLSWAEAFRSDPSDIDRPGAGLPPLLLHIRPEEIFDVDLEVVFGVFGEVEGGIQHAPDGDDADEVAD